MRQERVSEKSNEITAIPKLVEVLWLDNTIVTIDTMGCQTEIAHKIIAKNADYIHAVKENQPQLHEDIEDEFRFGKNIRTHLMEELDPGRIETRSCCIVTDFEFIESTNKGKNLATAIKMESTRKFKNSDRPKEKAVRYYISSLRADTEDF